MSNRIDAGAPQARTETLLAQVLEGEPGGLGMKAQRALQPTTPGGTPGKANRAMPMPYLPRTEGNVLSPMLREPKPSNRTPVPMPIRPYNDTAVPMPNWMPKDRTPNMTPVPMCIWPGHNTGAPMLDLMPNRKPSMSAAPMLDLMPNRKPSMSAVPMPTWPPKGEAVPQTGTGDWPRLAPSTGTGNWPRLAPPTGTGDWPRRTPPVCIDFEPPRGALAPDVKGTGQSPATPPSSVFTSPAQQEAFKSVVHLTDGGSGSGVIVANKGNEYMLLTNQHCLRGKTVGATVEFTLSDGTKLKGTIAALGDPKVNNGHDLAAITFTSTRKLTTAKIATTEPKPEQKTFSIGYPFSGTLTETSKPSDRVDPRTGAMVAEGMITANRRDGEGQINGEYGLVTTSRVIQGMSGGGMFDAATGDLVAINGMSALVILPKKVQDGISFPQTEGERKSKSVGIAAAEIGQFLLQNKVALPDFARG